MISEKLRTFKFLAIGFITLLLPTVITTSCVCEGMIPGTSYRKTVPIHDRSQIVRPNHRVYRPKAPMEMPQPLGDSCWCSKLLLQPEKQPQATPHNSKPPVKKCSCSPRPSSNPPAPDSCSNCEKSGTSKNSIPADPVSQSLAIQAQKAINVPEAKLAFGFVSTPINSLRKNFIFTEIPEEDLFKMNNRIIALKVTQSAQQTPKEMEKYDCLTNKESNAEIEEERKCQHERIRQQKEHLEYKVEGEYKKGRMREQEQTQEYERQQEPEKKSRCEEQKERGYQRNNEQGYKHVSIEKQEKEREYEHVQEAGRIIKCDLEKEPQYGRVQEQHKQHPETKLQQVYKEEPPRSFEPPCPSYEMIGFLPENFQDPKFKKLLPCVPNTNNKILTSYKARGNCGCKRDHITRDDTYYR